ncbi:MAG: PD40 domain-containing protein [Acidobacteria bacterium]|nr:PD40 domain-containing protein [Acidobacteriota bacterium]
MSAILKEEPPEISATNQNFSPALDTIVRHCLEKSPEERFQSARDIAFNLEVLAGAVGPSTTAMPIEGARKTSSGMSVVMAPAPALKKRYLAAAALVGLGLLATVFFAGLRLGKTPPPSFQLLTFRRGTIRSARFAHDGPTIVYGASWNGNQVELFSTRPESPDSRALGFPGAEILAISPSGEMAISLGRHIFGPFMNTGTLARATFGGGASREVLEDVQQADWGPGGNTLAVVRNVGGRNRLEYPIGKVLYETAGWIAHPRVSPNGDLVAFIDHAVIGDDGGGVAVVDLSGKKKTLSEGWVTVWGLAWSRQGRDEIWFTATRVGASRALHAVSLSGQERLLLRAAGTLTLHDVAHDGRVLLTRDNQRQGIVALPPGETKERDLSWLDWSLPSDISPDGKTVLFSEAGEGGGATYGVYLRKTDSSPAVKIGEGSSQGLSPDGKWALSIISTSSAPQLVLFPTGPGEPKPLERQGMNYHGACWLPDGKRIAFAGNEPGRVVRIYVQDLAGGKPRPITPEGATVALILVSPDGRSVIGRAADRKYYLYPVEGGEPRAIAGLAPEDRPTQWSADGRSLYVHRRGELPARLYRLDLSTGRKELWKQFMPADAAGVEDVTPIPTSDGKAYMYGYMRVLSELYLVEGVK